MFIAPFTVVIDSREQLPFTFQNVRIDRRKAFVLTQIHALHTGDYSIVGCEDKICVERKSLEDLYQTLGKGRERFIRELERMQDFERSLIVIEASYQEIADPTKKDLLFRSKMHPNSVLGSINKWSKQFQKTYWLPAGNRQNAEQETFRFLLKFWQKTTNPSTDNDTEGKDNADDTDDTGNQATSAGCSGLANGV